MSQPSHDKPIFHQVADSLRQDIAAGLYQPGEAVPSIRAQATALRINPNTIKRAYDELQAEGIIEHRSGVGLFVTQTGVLKASAQTASVVRSAFEQGVRAGIAARVPRSEIDQAYAGAWDVVVRSTDGAVSRQEQQS